MLSAIRAGACRTFGTLAAEGPKSGNLLVGRVIDDHVGMLRQRLARPVAELDEDKLCPSRRANFMAGTKVWDSQIRGPIRISTRESPACKVMLDVAKRQCTSLDVTD